MPLASMRLILTSLGSGVVHAVWVDCGPDCISGALPGVSQLAASAVVAVRLSEVPMVIISSVSHSVEAA